MPAWILTLIENIKPLETVAAGVVKIAEAVIHQHSEGNASAAAEVEAAADDVTAALTENTPHDADPAGA